MRQLPQAEVSCNFIIEHVRNLMESTPTYGYWKFAMKASFIKAIMLATCMEFKAPKELLTGFACDLTKRLLATFYPELFEQGNSDSLMAKDLPDNYYSFQYRRAYGKLRRLGYFIPETL